MKLETIDHVRHMLYTIPEISEIHYIECEPILEGYPECFIASFVYMGHIMGVSIPVGMPVYDGQIAHILNNRYWKDKHNPFKEFIEGELEL